MSRFEHTPFSCRPRMDIECHPDDVIDKTGSTFRIAGPSAENRLTSAHASKVCGHVVFEIRSRTDRHARRNTSQRNWGVGEVRSDWSRDAAGTAQHDAANSSFVSLVTAAAAASAKLLLLLWRADLITRRRRASERSALCRGSTDTARRVVCRYLISPTDPCEAGRGRRRACS